MHYGNKKLPFGSFLRLILIDQAGWMNVDAADAFPT